MTKEIGQILEAYNLIDFNIQKAALATVVHVEGSSYRRPGARMLITDDGKLTGAISGGCLEGDALRKARFVMHGGKAMMVTYDTTDEDDAKFGVGLGCNGIIYILIEPVYPGKPANPIDLLTIIWSKRGHYVLVTLFSLSGNKDHLPGTCCLFTKETQLYGILADAVLSKNIEADAADAFKNRLSIFKEYQADGHVLTAFIEFVAPPVSIIILGAGNDVIPVTEMADVLGWETTVIDGRPSHARPERFPLAKKVISAKPEQLFAIVEPDEQTFFLLMTHNYTYDLDVLRQLLQRTIRYIGVLGPKKKLRRMLEDVMDHNVNLPSDISQVYGPVGLDIGAEAAEEIALSILAEIKAVSALCTGMYLRDKAEPIHHDSGRFSSILL